MNENTIKGQWEQVKGAVKETWGDLTDDEITQLEGNRQKLSGKIQERYGRAEDVELGLRRRQRELRRPDLV